MGIRYVRVGNFKALGDTQDIEIRPLTLFIGGNSSGKSSCLHAIAAMSQSAKLRNNRKPLVLDDEYAIVHLGRFIDAIHSKSYDDAITLGLGMPDVSIPSHTGELRRGADLRCVLQFKTVKKTQETYVESADIDYGSDRYEVRQQGDGYVVTKDGAAEAVVLADFGYGTDIVPGHISSSTRAPFELFMDISFIMSIVNSMLKDVLYLGPFREPPGRAYNTFGATPKEVGARGEATASLLANESGQRRREHIDQISAWLHAMSLGSELGVARLGGSDLFEVSVHTDRDYAIADLGYGMSQVLPVLTQCSFAEKRATLLFEQPELHLHPLAARRLINVFGDIIREKQCTVIAETHSKDMFKQLQRCVADGIVSLSDVLIYGVKRDNGKSVLKKLDINDDGEIYDNWDVGFDR